MKDLLKRLFMREKTSLAESEARQKAKLPERLMGHVGLPQGIIYSLESLSTYCGRQDIPVIVDSENGERIALVRLGKANYTLRYNSQGYFEGLNAGFTVRAGGSLPV